MLCRCVEQSELTPGEVAAAIHDVVFRGNGLLHAMMMTAASLQLMQEDLDDAAEDALEATSAAQGREAKCGMRVVDGGVAAKGGRHD
jgi:hypothetical protein